MHKIILLLSSFIFLFSNKALSIQYPSYSTTLKNGLKVIVCEKPGNEFLQVELWYRVGSKDEKPGLRGMAHLFEHMMFRGTEKYPGNSYFDKINETGGQSNAYTSFDRTVYHCYIPKTSIALAFDLEADRMNNLKVTQHILNVEREVVGEELRMGQNNWFAKIHRERYTHLYPENHPYEVDIIGNMNEILGFTEQECMEFYNNYYSPNNASLIIVGNVKSDEVFKLAEKYFSVVVKQISQKISNNIPSIFNSTIRQNEFNIDYPLQIYSFLYPIPESSHHDHLALSIFLDIVFTSENSIIKSRIVKREYLAFDVISINQLDALYPQWLIIDVVMSAQPGNIRVKKIIKEEINNIVENGFPPVLLEKYVSSYEKKELFEDYLSENISLKLGLAEYYFHDYNKAYTLIEDIKKITPDKLQQAAKKYFAEDKMQFINIKPIN